jgi:arylsulfatase A-like enzyme
MTGSHSTRVGIGGVLFPRNNHGLNPDEITLPELLKEQGYATAIIGKWHLGNQDMFQPLLNGPNTSTGGSAGPLKGGKGSTLEGGVRVPFLACWPGTIPAGTESDAAITGMDLLPTLTKLAGGDVPDDRVIDGKDIWSLLAGKPDAKSPHEAIYYLRGRGVQAIRMGDWKYMIAPAKEVLPEVEIELTPEEQKLPRRQRNALIKERPKAAQEKQGDVETLYNLSDDIGEQNNLFVDHREIAERLKKQMKSFSGELRKNTRPAGVASNIP